MNIGHHFLMLRKGFSPTPKSIYLRTHPTMQLLPGMMHERTLAHCLISEAYNNGRLYQQAPALQNYAVSLLLYMSDKRQYRCTGI